MRNELRLGRSEFFWPPNDKRVWARFGGCVKDSPQDFPRDLERRERERRDADLFFPGRETQFTKDVEVCLVQSLYFSDCQHLPPFDAERFLGRLRFFEPDREREQPSSSVNKYRGGS